MSVLFYSHLLGLYSGLATAVAAAAATAVLLYSADIYNLLLMLVCCPIHCNAAVSAGPTFTFVFTIAASAAAVSLHLVRRRASALYLLPGLVYNGLAALLFTSFSNCCVVFIPADLLFVIVGAPLRLYAVLPGVFSTLRCWRYATVLY